MTRRASQNGPGRQRFIIERAPGLNAHYLTLRGSKSREWTRADLRLLADAIQHALSGGVVHPSVARWVVTLEVDTWLAAADVQAYYRVWCRENGAERANSKVVANTLLNLGCERRRFMLHKCYRIPANITDHALVHKAIEMHARADAHNAAIRRKEASL